MENLISPLKKRGARVFIFGSRAMGRHKKFSDVDLLYRESTVIPLHEISRLLSGMEDSSFAYKIDLVRDQELAQSYRENVERAMVEL
ncbi:MAG: nucleotidyltransferase domain-containing protein [Bdellovibrionales bacterium]|nr:nucleotidyltransferase domain-containing protein [Bdellovibrionales bacterium]